MRTEFDSDGHGVATVLAGGGRLMPADAGPLYALPGYPWWTDANIVDKCMDELVIVRGGVVRRFPFHTLQGGSIRGALVKLCKAYADTDRIGLQVYSQPHLWFAARGSWAASALAFPSGVGMTQRLGEKLCDWTWMMNTIVRGADPTAMMVAKKGSVLNGSYAIRSSEFTTNIVNALRSAIIV